jgi:hypothetical protein
MSYRLKHIDVPHHPDLQTMVLNLDSYYLRFIYAYGRNTREKRFLKIEDVTGTWDHKKMMECYNYLNSFCWWWCKSNTFYMYFDDYKQWKEAKSWVKKNYPQVLELKKGKYCLLSFPKHA